jgi:hypothetical protein
MQLALIFSLLSFVARRRLIKSRPPDCGLAD